MELDAVERPRTLTRVEKVLVDATPCVLDSGSTDPLGLSVDVSPKISRKSSLTTGSLPLCILGLYQLVMYNCVSLVFLDELSFHHSFHY